MNSFFKIVLICFSIFIFSCEQKEYVKDFKVEGISVGESLLTYFSEEHILEFQRKVDIKGNPISIEDSIYIDSNFDKFQFETYQSLQVYYKVDDKDYTILTIGGAIFYGSDNQKCMNKLFEVRDILKEQYKSPKITENLNQTPYESDMGDTIYNDISFIFENDEMIMISCNDYDNELLNVQDYFDLQIYSAEITEYMGLI
tara:strand:- start:132 stop:731 length:600 start_codon:yes stop_codon:yes gene_type:complete